MQSVSRESYLAALGRLEAYAAGAGPGPSVPADAVGAAAALATVGDELLAVARLLESQPRLRRLLADPGYRGTDRAGLLDSLINTQVGAAAAGLMRILVSGRWSAPSELLDACERLGIEALLMSAAVAGDLAQVEDELYRFGRIVDSSVDLSGALGSRTSPEAVRQRLAQELLEGKAHPVTIRLVAVALHGLGDRSFLASLTRLVELAALRRDRHVAYVTVASPLSDAEQARLADALARISGRRVEIKLVVDPSVLGGALVRLGHDLYDGTVVRRLADTRAALAAPLAQNRRKM